MHQTDLASNAVVIKATPFPKKHYPVDTADRIPGVAAVPVASAYRDRETEESSGVPWRPHNGKGSEEVLE